jgi:pentatricopeptide repeat protein
MEWVEQSKQFELGEHDYASRLDLIAKISGLHKAEQYIDKIPASHRGEIAYRTLLTNCVAEANVRKAEQVFNKMQGLGLPVTIFACNQLLLLYKRLDKKKIAHVLAMMEREDVKPSLFTYKLLCWWRCSSSQPQEHLRRPLQFAAPNTIRPSLEQFRIL